MKSVLVITYAWPPASGGGVQRILNFCKYLKEYGYQPTVITSHNSDYFISDEGLVMKTRGIEVYNIDYWFNPVRWFSSHNEEQIGRGAQSGPLRKIKRRLLEFIWLNIFIPDAKIGWYLPARNKIKELLKDNHFDALITTGPPYTAHLLGNYIKNTYGLPWVVDIRDPWVEQASYNVAYRFGFVKAINRYLEKKVLDKCDAIVTVGEVLANLIRQKNRPEKVSIIYNGYDRDDFKSMAIKKISRFRLGYYGHINDQRLPRLFIYALAKMLHNNKEFRRDFMMEIFGRITPEARSVIESNIPAENIKIHINIDHAHLVEEYGKEQVLLLLINNIEMNDLIITGKIFEYLHAGWPILGIGPVTGEAAKILNRAESGNMFDYNDTKNQIEWISGVYKKWKNGELDHKPFKTPLYDREEQAKVLSQVLDKITEAAPAQMNDL